VPDFVILPVACGQCAALRASRNLTTIMSVIITTTGSAIIPI